jgi:hypothetical protein
MERLYCSNLGAKIQRSVWAGAGVSEEEEIVNFFSFVNYLSYKIFLKINKVCD